MSYKDFYNYTESNIDSVIKNMEKGRNSVLTVKGWRSAAAYNFLAAFASVETKSGIVSGITSIFYSFLLPSLALVAGKSRVLGYSITANRVKNITTIYLSHVHEANRATPNPPFKQDS